MVGLQAPHCSIFRSAGAASLGAPLARADRHSVGHCSYALNLRASAASDRSVSTGISTIGSEAEWAEALARTKQCEAVARSKREVATVKSQQQAEAAEVARQRSDDEKQQRVEARQKRLDAMIVAKETRRRAEAEAARQREATEAVAFSRAVAERKQQEREIRAMAGEEHAMRTEVARRDAHVNEVEIGWQLQFDIEAAASAAEVREKQQMECEDALAQNTRAVDREAMEREQMGAEDSASHAAAEAAASKAWADSVQQAKAAMREERHRLRREMEVMGAEDCASRQLREKEREFERIKVAQAAAVAAAAIAATQRASEEVRRQRTKELECMLYNAQRMEYEDRHSRLREQFDASHLAEKEWRQAVSSQKAANRVLRKAETEEAARMHCEDVAASAMRHEEQKVEAQRREACRVLEEVAVATARAAELEVQQCFAAASEAERVRAREEVMRQVAEHKAMAVEDACGHRKRACVAAEEQRFAEHEAMNREDSLAHAARRNARASQRFMTDVEREFQSKKAAHRREAQDFERRRVQEGVEKQLCAAFVEGRESALKHATEKEIEHANEVDTARCRAEDAQRRAHKVASEQRQALAESRHRNVLLADEDRKFKELYKQNRTFLAAHRRKEEEVDTGTAASQCREDAVEATKVQDNVTPIEEVGLGSVSLPFGCNAAEIVAFAQKLSESSPALGGGAVELDGTATFFTEG